MEQHILTLISDYVLGLAPETDRQMLETHVLTCVACRRALERERAIEGLVRQTVHVATQPRPAQLQSLRPAFVPRRVTRPVMVMQQLAPVVVLLVILAGTLALQTSRLAGGLEFRAPSFSQSSTPTVTSTSTPTATIAGLLRPAVASPPESNVNIQLTVLAGAPLAPQEATPVDAPALATPVAAAPGSTTN